MITIMSLWLPILLSAVAVFIASSITHMLLPYHRTNFSKIDDEDEFRKLVGPINIAPGEYMFPFCSGPKAMDSEDYQAKLTQGPVGMMTVLPNAPLAMGKSLIQWFLYCLFIGLFSAYIAVHGLAVGADYLKVMQIVGASSFGCYAIGQLHESIWYSRRWSTTAKFIFDGLIYAALTGGIFGWLWPAM